MVFAVARRGHGYDPEDILYHLMTFSSGREKGVSSGEKGFLPIGIAWLWLGWGENCACESLSLLYTLLTNIIAATAPFLVSLLFPVNYSYLNS